VNSYYFHSLSQAVQVDKTLYISGQLGLNKDGVLANGIKAQTRQTLDNIGHILEAAGASFKNGNVACIARILRIGITLLH